MNGIAGKVAIIMPALNEEQSIGKVLADLPEDFRAHIYIGDNGSTDNTAEVAKSFGANVVSAPQRGYGSACLAAVREARKIDPDVLVFLDADYSDFPQDIKQILFTLQSQKLDLVIGNRMTSLAEPGALLPQAKLGNKLATFLMALRFRYQFSDLGPFRAIRFSAYERLGMKDPNFGWTMEMQIKALRLGLRVGEVPVRYRKRVGVSKITGTLSGTFMAGYKILLTLFKYSVFDFDLKRKSSPQIAVKHQAAKEAVLEQPNPSVE